MSAKPGVCLRLKHGGLHMMLALADAQRKRLPNTSCSMFSVCLGVGNLPRRYPVPHGWSQGV